MPSSSDGSPTNRSRSRPRHPSQYDEFAGETAVTCFPFWCHQCRSTVELSSPIPPLVCPTCNGEFLEELDLNPNPSPFPSPPYGGLRLNPSPFYFSQPGEGEDEHDHEREENVRRFLDLPGSFPPNLRRNHNFIEHRGHNYHEVFERLMQHIDTTEVDFNNVRGPFPASKASINAIPTIQITESFLAADPNSSCAVCKEEFVLGSEVKKLPCNHIYHGDCIIPWLTQHNSCPVCRFQLPTSSSGSNIVARDQHHQQEEGPSPSLHAVTSSRSRRRLNLRVLRNSTDADMVEALNMGGMLANIARRNRVPIPVRSGSGGGVSPTQMAEAHAGGSVGPANSLETVSSVWRDGNGGVAGTSAVERADEETDVVMSTYRRGFHD